jgi:hypothetical protein
MNLFNERIRLVIYWVGLGAGLVVYAHANFSTVKQVDKIEKKIEGHATKSDIIRLESKIDNLTMYLLGAK